MKKFLVAAIICAVNCIAVDSFAATTKSPAVAGCSTVLDVRTGGRFVYKNSAPVRASSAITAPIVGFRQEPTLICYAKICNQGSIPVLDSKGKTLRTCPWASARDAAGGRARCAFNTGALRRSAISSTRSPSVLFKINSTTCVSVPDAGKCYGSNKGLCNRTLQ